MVTLAPIVAVNYQPNEECHRMPLPSTSTSPHSNDYRNFAKKLSRIAHPVQIHSNELSALVAISKRRSLTEWE